MAIMGVTQLMLEVAVRMDHNLQLKDVRVVADRAVA